MKYIVIGSILLGAALLTQADDILLQWEPNDPVEAVTQYNVYWRPVQTLTNWIRISRPTTTNELSVTQVMTLANRVYQFTVTAVNLVGEGPMSDIVSYTNQVVTVGKPTKPIGLKVLRITK